MLSRMARRLTLATDGLGGECTSTVTVCVPHDMNVSPECGDQGPIVDSTGLEVATGAEATVGIACGLGFELVWLLPPLMWLRHRRRR